MRLKITNEDGTELALRSLCESQQRRQAMLLLQCKLCHFQSVKRTPICSICGCSESKVIISNRRAAVSGWSKLQRKLMVALQKGWDAYKAELCEIALNIRQRISVRPASFTGGQKNMTVLFEQWTNQTDQRFNNSNMEKYESKFRKQKVS
jgi:hypothetical protein